MHPLMCSKVFRKYHNKADLVSQSSKRIRLAGILGILSPSAIRTSSPESKSVPSMLKRALGVYSSEEEAFLDALP
jgi:hypothetical protein